MIFVSHSRSKPKSFPYFCIIFLKQYSNIISFWCYKGEKKTPRAFSKQYDMFDYSDFFFLRSTEQNQRLKPMQKYLLKDTLTVKKLLICFEGVWFLLLRYMIISTLKIWTHVYFNFSYFKF